MNLDDFTDFEVFKHPFFQEIAVFPVSERFILHLYVFITDQVEIVGYLVPVNGRGWRFQIHIGKEISMKQYNLYEVKNE